MERAKQDRKEVQKKTLPLYHHFSRNLHHKLSYWCRCFAKENDLLVSKFGFVEGDFLSCTMGFITINPPFGKILFQWSNKQIQAREPCLKTHAVSPKPQELTKAFVALGGDVQLMTNVCPWSSRWDGLGRRKYIFWRRRKGIFVESLERIWRWTFLSPIWEPKISLNNYLHKIPVEPHFFRPFVGFKFTLFTTGDFGPTLYGKTWRSHFWGYLQSTISKKFSFGVLRFPWIQNKHSVVVCLFFCNCSFDKHFQMVTLRFWVGMIWRVGFFLKPGFFCKSQVMLGYETFCLRHILSTFISST